jgi:2'-5' RNA ligase
VGFERRPYIPHVTLLREARRAPASLAMPGLAWPVSRYVLLESARRERGNVYRILREWPLDAAA